MSGTENPDRTAIWGLRTADCDSLNHKMNTKMPNQLERVSAACSCPYRCWCLSRTSFSGQLHPSLLAALEAKATFEFCTRPKRANRCKLQRWKSQSLPGPSACSVCQIASWERSTGWSSPFWCLFGRNLGTQPIPTIAFCPNGS